MTKKEAAIIMAYTDTVLLTGDDFSIFHKYIEEKLQRPVWTHEFADKEVEEKIKEATKEDLINLCKNLKDDMNARWEYVRYDPDYLTWSGTCTACHCKHESNEPVSKLPFCPHCGAKMNGEKKPELVVSGEDQK